MATTFLHTADWQIGKPFAGIADMEKRSQVRQERIEAIGRLKKIITDKGASFVVVAGDTFDTPTTSKATVSAACSAIGELEVPVYLIPGNHDHGGPGCLWEQQFFKSESETLAPNLRVLLESERMDLPEAVLFPCPLTRRHQSDDPTAWLRAVDEASSGNKPRVVLAHGSIQGFESESDQEDTVSGVPNLIHLDFLSDADFDYIALGDWHGTKQVGPKAWYSGTPEMDRFPKGKGNAPGHVLAVSVERGGEPEVEVVRTAKLGWHQLDFDFSSDADLDRLKEMVGELIANRAGQDLLRLSLNGSLGMAATTRLESMIDVWGARLLRLKLSNHTVIAPSEEEVEALTRRSSDPLISRVAAELVGRTADPDEETAAIARVALRELHAACTAD